jgi:phosphoribosylanthranilate isomerase
MKIKVCGMRDSENISSLIALSPDFIGFIFYRKSSRYVTDFPQVEIPSTIKKVGVFVNEKLDEVLKMVINYQLDCVQLHGNETAEYCQKLRQFSYTNIGIDSSSPYFEIIKAFSVADDFDFTKTVSYQNNCDYLLFDTKGKDYGGNGVKFNWKILKKYKYKTPYFLSGGIGLEEKKELKEFLRRPESNYCVAVDVNSRFEISPGVKNIEKLKEFKFDLL